LLEESCPAIVWPEERELRGASEAPLLDSVVERGAQLLYALVHSRRSETRLDAPIPEGIDHVRAQGGRGELAEASGADAGLLVLWSEADRLRVRVERGKRLRGSADELRAAGLEEFGDRDALLVTADVTAVENLVLPILKRGLRRGLRLEMRL